MLLLTFLVLGMILVLCFFFFSKFKSHFARSFESELIICFGFAGGCLLGCHAYLGETYSANNGAPGKNGGSGKNQGYQGNQVNQGNKGNKGNQGNQGTYGSYDTTLDDNAAILNGIKVGYIYG